MRNSATASWLGENENSGRIFLEEIQIESPNLSIFEGGSLG